MRAPAERGEHLHVGEDHPLSGGQAGLRCADALRRALPLVAPHARRAAQDVVEQTLVVLLLGHGVEGRELLGPGPRLRRDKQREGGEPASEASRAHPARPAAARASFASATRATSSERLGATMKRAPAASACAACAAVSTVPAPTTRSARPARSAITRGASGTVNVISTSGMPPFATARAADSAAEGVGARITEIRRC